MSGAADTVAYVGLGSNLDRPDRRIRDALEALGQIADTRLLRHSRLFRTRPWGVADQPDFINAVAELATRLSPRALLDALLAVERAQGRVRDGTRWGPRVLDLDLLLYGDRRIDEPGLTIPHPRIGERAFVLKPLADLDIDLDIPGQGRVGDLLARIDPCDAVAMD